MTIRTEEEHRRALTRLEESERIMRARSFTDDEQRDFDHLVGDLADYKARQGQAPQAAAPTFTTPVASPPPALPRPPTPSGVDVSRANMERQISAAGRGPVDLVADMRRRHPAPIAAPSPSASSGVDVSRASMERELARAGRGPVDLVADMRRRHGLPT